jgi:threonyl-tRNA synthetase
MFAIHLPNNKTIEIAAPIAIRKIFADIPEIGGKAIAAKIDENIVDLDTVVEKDCAITPVFVTDPAGLEILRHSAAHVLAHAVKLLYPNAQLAIGPAIENGFYYDFAIPETLSIEDLANIEKKMKELIDQKLPITKTVGSRAEEIEFLNKCNEPYKLKLLAEIPEGEEITVYQQGDFFDLCRGPHVPHTGWIKAFKLTKLAGAYWRGDSKNEMLQRIYGTAFATKDDLNKYLAFLEEAEKRDHRKIGKAMDLFHMQEQAPGMAFWHHNGYLIHKEVIGYMREMLKSNDYQEVFAPLILDRSLWEKSGHWDKFGTTNMFTTQSEERLFAIKPMNCVGHIQIFNQQLHSYRDLPIRMAEFGICHRNEASGTLHGLFRVREFIQDDAHVFCTPDQLNDEINKLITLVYNTYRDFGFTNVKVRLATRPAKSIGEDEEWQQAEFALADCLNKQNIVFELAPGEGAFYGPKIEFHLQDCLNRVWQCGTIQVDFAMPKRLGAEYVAANSARNTPVMIHRAILGSVDRFIGILLEHYAGLLPLWLAPVQVVVMNITKEQEAFALEIKELANKFNLRVNLDLRNEKIGFKIREHTLAKVPYLFVIGNREVENRQVAVRTNDGTDLGSMGLNDFLDKLRKEAMPPYAKSMKSED